MGPPGPLRSDGCPDMRYSCNRSWASSSGSSVPLTTGGFYSSDTSRMGSSSGTSSSAAPRHSSLQLRAVAENAPARLRSDGLPDMRYSANKSFVAERNLPVPLTTTSKKNSFASSNPTKSSESAKTSLPSSSSYSSTSYSNYYAPPVYVPIPVPVLAQSSQPERKRNSDVQDDVTQLEETLRVMELKKKIQDLEKSLKESKAKEAIPTSAKSTASSAISTGARSRVSTTEKSYSTFSRIQTEMHLLQSKLEHTIATTEAVMVSRKRVVQITDNFQQPIGRGGFGQVFKGSWNKQQVAVKEIHSPWRCSTVSETRSFSKMIQREVEALSAVQHPNIIKLLGVCTENELDEGKGSIGVSLIFDFANGGTLFDCLFGTHGNKIVLDMKQIMLIARDLIEALHLLHSTRQEPSGTVMVHRDVKSANVLLHRDEKGTVIRAVLADFGLARFHSDLNEKSNSEECGRLGLAASSMTAVVGTHGYVDPLYAESSQVAPSQDVYAYGVVLYEMLWRERPETMLARRVRQSQIEDCVAKSENNVADKFSVLARLNLLELAKIGKRCVSMEQRPSSAEIRKLLGA